MVRPSHPIVTSISITSRHSLRSALHSALKEFIEPLRTGDSRADFFTTYRKQSEEFDRDHTGKYDEDLNTSLIFVSFLPPSLVAPSVSSRSK